MSFSQPNHFQVIVVGGGHAGVEAAWAAANLLREPGSVALVTLDPAKIGVMSCNPAIGGLAKGQIVREIDALGGLMGLATDATGIQFKVLNTSKGPAVHGPRAQCDKHAYAEQVQTMIRSRPEIVVVPGSVESFCFGPGRVLSGAIIQSGTDRLQLHAPALVLTTGTFMRGLMHTGESKTAGGRYGEAAAVGISGTLKELGFELGRLKTGTPPRLKRSTILWDALERAGGDAIATPFSDLSGLSPSGDASVPSLTRLPVLEQVECRVTTTCHASHQVIRDNLHRAPMYSGQIESAGPRYCPSIEDKVVRFADRESHHVYLEPESLRDDWIYCNGISTSLPKDVQDQIVRLMPGCEQAEIYRYGYAVEYDMVRPHQIRASGMTKLVDGLFLAGQINGTSGYEEAAGQGLIAGLNAARFVRKESEVTFGREQAYIGVLMDDLVTKTPIEPYRMFTSRAEHRLLLRADNAPDRLTALGAELGLLGQTPLGHLRAHWYAQRVHDSAAINAAINRIRVDSVPLKDLLKRPEFLLVDLAATLAAHAPELDRSLVDPSNRTLFTVFNDRCYEPYIERQRAEVRRAADMERRTIPATFDYASIPSMRTEARHALGRFRPSTLGQAGRLEGITPADITLLSVFVQRYRQTAGRS